MNTLCTSTILVVDDSRLICRFIEEALKAAQFDVLIARDGETALSLVSENSQKIDVVLSDVMMPGIDGMELMAKIHELFPDIPVVLMTAFSDVKVLISALKQRAFDLLLKPVEKAQLLLTMEKACKHRRLVELENNYLETLKKTVKEQTRELQKSMEELEASRLSQAVEHERLKTTFQMVNTIKQELQQIMDCVDDMILLVDHQGLIRRCNHATVKFCGSGYENLIGMPWQSFVEDNDLQLVSGFFPGAELRHEASGRWFRYNPHQFSSVTDGSKGVVVTIIDTTEQKNTLAALEQTYLDLKATQDQMLQTEKMVMIGQLAAGVAHEINNPIGFVSSNLGTLQKYAERLTRFFSEQDKALQQCAQPTVNQQLGLLRQELKVDYILSDLKDLISESCEGANRVNKIVADLKMFARVKDEEEMIRTDLNDCIESAITIVWNELKYKAELVRDFSPLPEIDCYPHKLSQVFMNLLVNAAHAIEKRGRITISTRANDKCITVVVADTGAGIAQDNLARIFEPFFTTKEIGKGTGLGLSISYDIIKKHHGEISAKSEVGKGTAFTISLPLPAP